MITMGKILDDVANSNQDVVYVVSVEDFLALQHDQNALKHYDSKYQLIDEIIEMLRPAKTEWPELTYFYEASDGKLRRVIVVPKTYKVIDKTCC